MESYEGGRGSSYPARAAVTYSRGLTQRQTNGLVQHESSTAQFGEIIIEPHEYITVPVADMPEIAVANPNGSVNSISGIVSVVKAVRRHRPIATAPGYINQEYTSEFIIADPRRLPTGTLMNTIENVASLGDMSVKELRLAMQREAMVVVGGRALLEEDGAGDEVLRTDPRLGSAGVWGLGMGIRTTVMHARELMGEGRQYLVDCHDNRVVNAGWLALHANTSSREAVRPVLTIYGGSAVDGLQNNTIGSLVVGASALLAPRTIPKEVSVNLTTMANRLTNGVLRRSRDIQSEPDSPGRPTHVGPNVKVFSQPSKAFFYDNDNDRRH